MIVVLAGLLIFFVILFIVWVNYYNKHQIKEHQKNVLKMQFSQTLLQSHVEILEQSLLQMRREMHDNLGQVASLIKIYLNTMPLHDAAQTTAKIDETKVLVQKLINDLKDLSQNTGAELLNDGGLVRALETDVKRLNNTGKLVATLSTEGNIPSLDHDKSVILYRITQEILNDMVKNNHTKEISILLQGLENTLVLSFNHSGTVPDADPENHRHTSSLQNLQKKARLINAQVLLKSVAINGTQMRIEMPIYAD